MTESSTPVKATRPKPPEANLLTNKDASELLDILLKLAGDSAIRRHKCLEMDSTMKEDEVPAWRRVQIFAATIDDGLSHGNWPWNLDQLGRL